MVKFHYLASGITDKLAIWISRSYILSILYYNDLRFKILNSSYTSEFPLVQEKIINKLMFEAWLVILIKPQYNFIQDSSFAREKVTWHKTMLTINRSAIDD